jgi:hypothetical protein
VTFAAARTSRPMTSFPLSTQVGGGSGTVGLTKTVFEVEGISEVEATYPSPVLSVGLF